MTIRSLHSPGWALVLVCAAQACSPPPAGDVPAPSQLGVIVMAHGGSDEWNESVREAVRPLEQTLPVAIAFGMADPKSLQEAVTVLERQAVDWIAVVRLFVSAQSFAHDTEYFLGLRHDPPQRFAARSARAMAEPRPIARSAGIGLNQRGLSDSPLIGDILAERALAQSVTPRNETVLILAHGMGSDSTNERLLKTMDGLAAHVRSAAPFHDVIVETLREDWSGKREMAERRIRQVVTRATHAGNRVIVVPFRLSGFGPYSDVLNGLTYVADGLGLIPHPNVTAWIAEEASQVFRRAGKPNPFRPGMVSN